MLAAARHCNTAARFLNHGTSDLKRSPSPAVEESQTGREEGRARIGRGQIQTEERETWGTVRQVQTDSTKIRQSPSQREDRCQTGPESDRDRVRQSPCQIESHTGRESDRTRDRQSEIETGSESDRSGVSQVMQSRTGPETHRIIFRQVLDGQGQLRRSPETDRVRLRQVRDGQGQIQAGQRRTGSD